MNVTIISHFRNAVGYLERYCEQMDDLQRILVQGGNSLTLVLGYGDSSDGTGEALYDECISRFNATLVNVSHGGMHFGSVVHPERFKQLAGIGNKLWQLIPGYTDIVGMVESDLIWKAETLVELMEELEEGYIVAPMVYHLDGRFYDTWAFRMKGINFKNDKPYHPSIRPGVRCYEMNSVGSVLFMNYNLASRLHWPEEDVVVGLCRQAREEGATIVLDSYLGVYHP